MAKGRKNQTWIKNVKRNVRIVVEEEVLIVCITVSQNGWKIEGSSNIVQMFDSERFSRKYTAFYHSQQNSRISPLGLGNMKHANIACLGFGKGKHALKEKHITYKDPKVAILGLWCKVTLQWENFLGPSYVWIIWSLKISFHILRFIQIHPVMRDDFSQITL